MITEISPGSSFTVGPNTMEPAWSLTVHRTNGTCVVLAEGKISVAQATNTKHDTVLDLVRHLKPEAEEAVRAILDAEE